MSSARIPDRPALYHAAERFVEEGLRRDGSLFLPGWAVWRLDVAEEFHRRFIENPDMSDDRFAPKLRRQLEDASAEVAQFGGELIFTYSLASDRMKPGTVQRLVNVALDTNSGTKPIPDDLRQSLGAGIAKTGAGLHSHRYWMISFLVQFVCEWKRKLSPENREELLKDPWAFRDFVFTLPMHAAQTQRSALLHIVHPDTFEPIVSERHKQQIVETYAEPGDPDEVLDRRLARIRPRVEKRFGNSLNYYDPRIMTEWQPVRPGAWKEMVHWMTRFVEWDGFDAAERDYKLEFAKALQEARAQLQNGEDPWDRVLAALRTINLVSWRNLDALRDWLTQHPDRALAALKALWLDEGDVTGRIGRFAELTEDGKFGEKVRFAAALLMAINPALHPPYAQEMLRKAYALTGFGDPPPNATPGERYAHAIAFFERAFVEAGEDGLELRDLLDAQSAVWSVIRYPSDAEPVSSWGKREQNKLRRFQERGGTGPNGQNGHPFDLAGLADELLLDAPFLQRVQRLLEAKRQVIFYGPPGTGKTYVARKLANELAGQEHVRLVQLHPSYTYEDFVEGFRPSADAGASGFTLVDGALKRIARDAAAKPDETFILIIDELNRGNVAKVFGELYFLLEYRGEHMDLQYSREPFRLPENLWFIGTMNTADRSIALMDAALRRRFFFVPFFPDQEPIRGLLKRWLDRNKPELGWLASVVEEANRLLADPHFSIGPSHFMREDLDEEWVELIWAHSIRPTLEEHLFGRDAELQAFSLTALMSRVGGAARSTLASSTADLIHRDPDD